MDFLDICTMVFATYKTRRNFKLLIFLLETDDNNNTDTTNANFEENLENIIT